MVILPLYNQVNKALSQSEFVSSDGEFLTGKIFEAIESLDKTFLSFFLKEKTTKEHFFDTIDDVFVLNQNKLFDFFNAKEYFDSSFTSYTPKIGLIRKDSFIKKFDDTVLAWPYKDCILEGGMSSEDAGKKEVFYNTIISKDEIDRLFEPKVFANIKRYSVRPEPVVGLINGSTSSPRTCEESIPSEITLDDNLILKGNNLLALHSLKKRYIDQNGGMIKLIYIDPPYNTGNDGFKYNDRFNHSTWLTFMKNRLEVARELLRDDGIIFISIDDDESHYLKILCDEVFKRENFVANIVWQKKYSPQNDAKWFSDTHDHIMVIAKNKNIWRPNLLARTDEQNNRYKNPDNDPRGNWKTSDLSVKRVTEKDIYEIITPSGRSVYPPQGRSWATSYEKYLELVLDNRIWFGVSGNSVPQLKRFITDVQDGMVPKTIWLRDEVGDNQDAKNEIKELFKKDLFSTPKPEKLIQRIIELSTNEGDIVLDYHLGSGTTAAVAHKMNRRYIGIEQMDYIETISVERLKKVIEGEQGGISKTVGWNGGGSFVYAELHETDDFNEADTIGRLNDNMRYLPISEIDDESYGVSDEEKRINKQFYGIV